MGRKKAEFHRHNVNHYAFKVNATCIFGWRLNPFYPKPDIDMLSGGD
jgi:hypothetical protein